MSTRTLSIEIAAAQSAAAQSAVAGRARVVLWATFAIAFGAFLVFGAGLANPSAIHDAAHDTRHALSFPCH